mgnify:CR=1 FL=1
MKTKQPELNKITALYERLSRDDEQSGDTKHRRKDKNGNPTGKYTNAQDNYTCSTYSKVKNKVNWNYQ